jgi:hypothetical protein
MDASGCTKLNNPPTHRYPMKVCICLMVALLAVQLAISISLIVTDPTIGSDAITYAAMARQWSHDPAMLIRESRQHPGYPITVATVHDYIWPGAESTDREQWELAGRCVSLVCGMLITVGLVIFLHMTFASKSLPWLTVGFLILGRKFASLGAMHLTDFLSLSLQIWGLVSAVVAVRLMKRGSWWAILPASLTGAAGGLGYIVRPEAAAVGLIGAAIWIATALYHRKHIGMAVVITLAGIVTAIACSLPYMLAIGEMSKKQALVFFIPGSNAIARPPTPTTTPATTTKPPAIPDSRTWPRTYRTVKITLIKFAAGIHPVLAGAMALWAGLWLVSLLKPLGGLRNRIDCPNRMGLGIIFVTAVIILTPVILRYLTTDAISYRYMLLLICVSSGLAGAGLIAIASALKTAIARVGWSKSAQISTVSVAAILVAAAMAAHTLRPLHSHVRHVLKASDYVEARIGDDQEIISNAPHLLYRCGYYQMDDSMHIRLPIILNHNLRMLEGPWFRKVFAEALARTDRPVAFVALNAEPESIKRSTALKYIEEKGFTLVKEFKAFDDTSWTGRLYRSLVTTVFESQQQAAQQVLLVYRRNPQAPGTTAPGGSLPTTRP